VQKPTTRDTSAMADLEILPLTGPTWPALETLFEKGGDPSRCWCALWRFTATESSRMSMIDGDNVWSVTCFVVDRSVRGQGCPLGF